LNKITFCNSPRSETQKNTKYIRVIKIKYNNAIYETLLHLYDIITVRIKITVWARLIASVYCNMKAEYFCECPNTPAKLITDEQSYFNNKQDFLNDIYIE